MKKLIMIAAAAALSIVFQDITQQQKPLAVIESTNVKAIHPTLPSPKAAFVAETPAPIESSVPADDNQSDQNKIGKVEQDLIDHMLSKGVAEKNAALYASLIVKHCETYDVDPYTVLAMIQVESYFSPDSVGKNNDVGLMQIRPSAQKATGIKGDRREPSVNIEIGVSYLAYNQDRFGEELGIIAYNQGEGNVSRGTYRSTYFQKVSTVLKTINKNA
ncbi:transglycosylase SLT domain-containing protein [Paenibacillus sp. CAU 1782]